MKNKRVKTLNEFQWRVAVHGVGMAGFDGKLTWTAICDISTNKVFDSKEEAMRHFHREFRKKMKVKKWCERSALTLVQFIED